MINFNSIEELVHLAKEEHALLVRLLWLGKRKTI